MGPQRRSVSLPITLGNALCTENPSPLRSRAVPIHCARHSFDKESRRWNWLQEPLRVTKSKPSMIINEVDVEIRGMDKAQLIKVKRPDGNIGYREKEEPSLDLPVDLSTREGYESIPLCQRTEAVVRRQISRKAHEALQAKRAARNPNRPPSPEPARPPTPKYHERYNMVPTDSKPQRSRRRKAEPAQDTPADSFRVPNGDTEGLMQLLEMINATRSRLPSSSCVGRPL
ncbi:hypothetical protein FB45DRAFT_78642 [Roridomyces roridus]|uniref:Uncharacterized protein n=1 Tax=Roridomyces roridus TaxID=1738132 RepID=A0AAD7F7X9_9AGAR|nr:hypothetical protein FB45DRAFT_78642 [Roridomyces roridus]